eukprot:1960879-Karenia_brevis.AAC.1
MALPLLMTVPMSVPTHMKLSTYAPPTTPASTCTPAHLSTMRSQLRMPHCCKARIETLWAICSAHVQPIGNTRKHGDIQEAPPTDPLLS